ncbi:MAG: hypothetical protein AAF418_04540 [Pseudomonadota bacterium]
MRSRFLATSALIGSTMIAPTAFAQAPQLSISGTMTWYLAFLNEDRAPANPATGNRLAAQDDSYLTRGWDVRNQSSGSELHFEARGSSDRGWLAGWTYGARFDLRPIGNTTSDEAYIYMESDEWGRIHIGNDDGVKENMVSGGESVLAGRGGFDGVAGVQDNFGSTGALIGPDGLLANDDARIAYYSPEFDEFGFDMFKFGISIAPNPGSINTGLRNPTDNTPIASIYENSISWAWEVQHRIEDVDFSIRGGIQYAQSNRVPLEGSNSFIVPRSGSNDGRIGSTTVENAFLTEIGGTIKYSDFSFGVGYGDNGESGAPKFRPGTNQSVTDDFYQGGGYWYTVGLAYTIDQHNVSVGYFGSTREIGRQNIRNADVDSYALVFSADTKLAEGLTGFAELFFTSVDTNRYTNVPSDHNTDAVLLVVGTSLSF